MLDTSRTSHGSMHPISGSTYATQTDMKALVRDAQSMLTAAASLTGEKAEELRERGMAMLDTVLGGASLMPTQAVVKGKELVHSADDYVKHNPWRIVAAAAGVGVLIGLLISRKQ